MRAADETGRPVGRASVGRRRGGPRRPVSRAFDSRRRSAAALSHLPPGAALRRAHAAAAAPGPHRHLRPHPRPRGRGAGQHLRAAQHRLADPLLPRVAGVHVARLATREPHPLLRGLRRGDARAGRHPRPAALHPHREPGAPRGRHRVRGPVPGRGQRGDGLLRRRCLLARRLSGSHELRRRLPGPVGVLLSQQSMGHLPAALQADATRGRSPRRRSPTASRGSRSTATTCSPATWRRARRWIARGGAKGRR